MLILFVGGLGLMAPAPHLHTMDRWKFRSTNIPPESRSIWRTFYGIRVVTRDIPDPLTGDLDGSEIHIDYAVTPEQRLFLLGHLFGHTVQWNVDPALFEIGRRYQPPVKEDLIPAIIAYEREAACYGLAMFHQIGITGIDIDQWFCDYTACDQAYLLHFYRTGEKRDFRSFWRSNAPLIEPKDSSHFHPDKKISPDGWDCDLRFVFSLCPLETSRLSQR